MKYMLLSEKAATIYFDSSSDEDAVRYVESKFEDENAGRQVLHRLGEDVEEWADESEVNTPLPPPSILRNTGRGIYTGRSH